LQYFYVVIDAMHVIIALYNYYDECDEYECELVMFFVV